MAREWQGLAPAREWEAGADVRAAESAAFLVATGRLVDLRAALVPARRGADTPAAIGLGRTARPWDRFGVPVATLAFEVLVLSVAAPPVDPAGAEAMAAGQFGFCPDNVIQGSRSLRAYAKSLLGEVCWTFWWTGNKSGGALPRVGRAPP